MTSFSVLCGRIAASFRFGIQSIKTSATDLRNLENGVASGELLCLLLLLLLTVVEEKLAVDQRIGEVNESKTHRNPTKSQLTR